jgi:hypothetical protein
MRTIRIPKTPASAYNDARPASDLLRAHVENLEKAVHGSRKRSAVPGSLTEGEAARYIRELGRRLHQKELLPTVTAAPTIGQRPPASTPPSKKTRRNKQIKKKAAATARKTSKPSRRAPASRRSSRAKH